ncbi:MAG: glycosyltransferase family 4 protein [Bacteroides sp.]|jgi:glycosyltransferase involved in cell wall biosynthesis|nr:glycosyltransferase family 4 protein [Bacteroides sp.]
MKILQLANKLPYPAKDGGSIATLSMARTFAALGHEATVMAMNTSKHFFPLEDLPGELTSRINFHAVDIDTTIIPAKALRNFLFSDQPYNATRFFTEEFERKLAGLLQDDVYDVIQLEGLYLAPYVPVIRANSRALVSMRAHNVEHEIWQRTARQCRGIKKYYIRNLARRIKRMEVSYLNAYDVLVPITPRDAKIFSQLGCKIPVHVTPTGISSDMLVADRSRIEFPSLFHIGALDWTPNQEGLSWFLDKVWPGLHKNNPGLKFYIAGRNAPEKFRMINKENVVFLGEVDDAYEFMNSKAIMVVPLLSGSGMRIKIIEGMALGKTIVSTTLGAEGIQCEHGKNIVIADTPENIGEEIQSLLNNFDKFDSIGKQAMEFVSQTFDNKNITADLLAFYKKHLT